MAKAKHLIRSKMEHGYDKICPYCSTRWGKDVRGQRELTMAQCDSCRAKKLDLQSLEVEPYRNRMGRAKARQLALSL